MAAGTLSNAVLNDPPGVPGATPVVYKSPYPCIGGSARTDILTHRSRGNNMEYLNKNKPISKSRLTVDDTGNIEMDDDSDRVSRSNSISSYTEEGADQRSGCKRKKPSSEFNSSDNYLDDIKAERINLEEFLFNENNKVSKSAIKFILAKWNLLETKLSEERIEKEKLKATYRSVQPVSGSSYAQVAAGGMTATAFGSCPETEKKKVRENYEVALIRPIEETDKRNNEEIRAAVVKELGEVRRKLKVRGIRQMRKKGVIIQVKDKKDLILMKQVKLDKIGLKIEEPRKESPAIVIYNVERDYKIDELKEDFIHKNFDNEDDTAINRLKSEVNFRHSYKIKDNLVNWIVQVPGPYMTSLLKRGRIFLSWKTYRIKEHYNITRCYKCHGYGHIASVCRATSQLCESCGSDKHVKADCLRKETPLCINCVRNKRKNANHAVKSIQCPEYQRFLDFYRNRITWD